ncbi:MAG: thioredoxin family protein [bacterium]|uniref:Thioredoxin family protein n=2 Tax=Candidatus Infernicultor aquiphilus TaxID=1805029 RepID=A0A1J5GVF3_9BACT|nr:thioredoxin family protein [bacterium]OIP71774.1 MAG: thioredoxin family protein [Candidatus Atribacteria bacterium CG2_30_33_13]PIU24721.1 MAG: thioredoxin family protein [Candidatus Atribacteria bacterium CG08_land_8_20_14_0_20_33_29]PIW12595.1 MAG: thioredoxin family protein [Candidatus Atribacteria bacterium CG17_big_fil_post_rev_8_21_14_2_50_34_11]PIX33949.1 MAG: thioredoxin family protein [Candidatus Atribacteria bacterium CG_4_8_14_3_um_filter_34_18]PJB55945.1 MAG: thioredoxin family
MKIEILGTGCPKCKKLSELTAEAIKELGVSAEITKVTDLNKFIDYGVILTPALVINGEVKVAGKVPSKKEITKWIEEKKNK